jgi:hypothetical protein
MQNRTVAEATPLAMICENLSKHNVERTIELRANPLRGTPAPEAAATPSGRHLVPVLVSLICVVFLVSLDMVCAQLALRVSIH